MAGPSKAQRPYGFTYNKDIMTYSMSWATIQSKRTVPEGYEEDALAHYTSMSMCIIGMIMGRRDNMSTEKVAKMVDAVKNYIKTSSELVEKLGPVLVGKIRTHMEKDPIVGDVWINGVTKVDFEEKRLNVLTKAASVLGKNMNWDGIPPELKKKAMEAAHARVGRTLERSTELLKDLALDDEKEIPKEEGRKVAWS